MAHHHSWKLLATISLVGGLAANANAMPTFDFTFTGQCDDCAFLGDPSDLDFDPLDDGEFQTVTGTLRLTDVSTNVDGFIEVDSNNFDSFTYGGSSLLNAFTFDDAFLIQGLLSPSGLVQPAEALRLRSSDGTDGPFDFGDFCTPLGEQVIGDCSGVGIVTFELDSTGSWFVEGELPSDVGVGGTLVLVPEPGTAAVLGLGLLGVGFARRRSAGR